MLLDEIPGHQLCNGGRIAVGLGENVYETTGWARDMLMHTWRCKILIDWLGLIFLIIG